jgi:hypothetical protein
VRDDDGMRRLALAVSAALAAVILAGCGGSSAKATTKADWQKKNGALLTAYSRDLDDAITNITQGSRDDTLGSCTQVTEDGKDLRSKGLPISNAAANAALTKALDTGDKAAADCLQGGRNTQARTVEEAQAEFADARKAMDDAMAAIQRWQ